MLLYPDLCLWVCKGLASVRRQQEKPLQCVGNETSASGEVEDKTDTVGDRGKCQHRFPRSCFHFVFTGGKEGLGVRKAKCPAKPLRETEMSSQVSPSHHPCSGSMNSLTSPMLGWSWLGLREGAERVYMLPLLRSPTVECSAVQGSCTRPGADRLAV